MRITKKYLDDLTFKIIGAAIEVHKNLGPGLLEQVYERCLKFELEKRGIAYKAQQYVPLFYKGINLDTGLRFDLLIENQIVVELKAVEFMLPIFDAQLLTYMKLMDKPKGILINFNCTNIYQEGQRTMVNKLFEQLPDI
jgi:GxxExxY protein